LEVKPGERTPASSTINDRKKNPNIICYNCKKDHISSNYPRKELLQKVVVRVVMERVVTRIRIRSLILTRGLRMENPRSRP